MSFLPSGNSAILPRIPGNISQFHPYSQTPEDAAGAKTHDSRMFGTLEMNFKEIAKGFISTGLIVLVVSLVVTWLYSALVHGSGALDWESSIRLAIIFGITFPVVRALDKKKG
jgi:hypothetical protein